MERGVQEPLEQLARDLSAADVARCGNILSSDFERVLCRNGVAQDQIEALCRQFAVYDGNRVDYRDMLDRMHYVATRPPMGFLLPGSSVHSAQGTPPSWASKDADTVSGPDAETAYEVYHGDGNHLRRAGNEWNNSRSLSRDGHSPPPSGQRYSGKTVREGSLYAHIVAKATRLAKVSSRGRMNSSGNITGVANLEQSANNSVLKIVQQAKLLSASPWRRVPRAGVVYEGARFSLFPPSCASDGVGGVKNTTEVLPVAAHHVGLAHASDVSFGKDKVRATPTQAVSNHSMQHIINPAIEEKHARSVADFSMSSPHPSERLAKLARAPAAAVVYPSSHNAGNRATPANTSSATTATMSKGACLLSLRDVFRCIDEGNLQSVSLQQVYDAFQRRHIDVSFVELDAIADSLGFTKHPTGCLHGSTATHEPEPVGHWLSLSDFCMLVSRMRPSLIERVKQPSVWFPSASSHDVTHDTLKASVMLCTSTASLDSSQPIRWKNRCSHDASYRTPKQVADEDLTVSPITPARSRAAVVVPPRPPRGMSLQHGNLHSVSHFRTRAGNVDETAALGGRREAAGEKPVIRACLDEYLTNVTDQLATPTAERLPGKSVDLKKRAIPDGRARGVLQMGTPGRQRVGVCDGGGNTLPLEVGSVRCGVEFEAVHTSADRRSSVSPPSHDEGQRLLQSSCSRPTIDRLSRPTAASKAHERAEVPFRSLRECRTLPAPACDNTTSDGAAGNTCQIISPSRSSSVDHEGLPPSADDGRLRWCRTTACDSSPSSVAISEDAGSVPQEVRVNSEERGSWASYVPLCTPYRKPSHPPVVRISLIDDDGEGEERRHTSLSPPRTCSSDTNNCQAHSAPVVAAGIPPLPRRHTTHYTRRPNSRSPPSTSTSPRGRDGSAGTATYTSTECRDESLGPSPSFSFRPGVPGTGRIFSQAVTDKLNGRCAQFLSICTQEDTRCNGQLSEAKLRRVLTLVCPSLSDDDLSEVVARGMHQGIRPGLCSYIHLAEDLVVNETYALLPAPTASPVTRHSEWDPSSASSLHVDPSHSNGSWTVGVAEGEGELFRRIRHGQTRLKHIIRQKLQMVCGGNSMGLREYFFVVDDAHCGYLEERLLRQRLAELFTSTTGNSAATWLIERCTSIARLPFERERLWMNGMPLPPESEWEAAARDRVRRIPSGLWGVLSDYRFLLEELGL